jgi:hypothetical protein
MRSPKPAGWCAGTRISGNMASARAGQTDKAGGQTATQVRCSSRSHMYLQVQPQSAVQVITTHFVPPDVSSKEPGFAPDALVMGHLRFHRR